MTPLSPKEQIVLAGILAAFVMGSVLLVFQEKILDQQLAAVVPAELPPVRAKFGGPVHAVEKMAAEEKKSGDKVLPRIFTATEDSLVSLTRATAQELEGLPGIGPRLAEEIVQYREAHPFQCIEDLKKVPGIGPKRFEKIKDKVRVD